MDGRCGVLLGSHGQVSVDGGGDRRIMPQILLDKTQIHSGFQQMSGPRMAKGVNTGQLVDLALFESFFEGDLYTALRHGFGCTLRMDASPTGSREDEEWIAMSDPVAAKDLQGALR